MPRPHKMHDAMYVGFRRCRDILATASEEALRDYPDLYPDFNPRTLIEADLRYHLLNMKDVIIRGLPDEPFFEDEFEGDNNGNG